MAHSCGSKTQAVPQNHLRQGLTPAHPAAFCCLSQLSKAVSLTSSRGTWRSAVTLMLQAHRHGKEEGAGR